MAKYEVIKGNIYGKTAGEIVELDKSEAKAYGKNYLKPAPKAEPTAEEKEAKKKTDEEAKKLKEKENKGAPQNIQNK